MKHPNISKFTLFTIVIVLISIVSTEATESKVESKVESKCEDSCKVCQRVVYQMKFQQMADCEDSRACKDTCYKVRDAWGNPINPFEPFLKDVFGKCEICFRAGHCTISQCKDQERNELEIVNRIINSSHLTAKVDEELVVSFPDAPDAKALPKVIKTNQKVEHILNKDLKAAVAMGTTQNVVPKLQNLVSNYFSAPQRPIQGSAYQILNEGKTQPKSAAELTYWNDNKGNQQVNSTQKVVKKLNNHLQEIQKLQQQAAKGKEGKKQNNAVRQVVKKEKKHLDRLVTKVNRLNKRLQKKEKALQKIASSTAVQNPDVKVAVNNSLNQVKQYSAAVNDVKKQLQQDKVNLNKKKKSKLHQP